MKKGVLILLVVLLSFCSVECTPVAASESTDKEAVDIAELEHKYRANQDTYSEFLYLNAERNAYGEKIILKGTDATASKDDFGCDYLQWNVSSQDGGRYYVCLTYLVYSERHDIERKLTVNGKIQYNEMRKFILPREYCDIGKPEKDYYGNEMRTDQQPVNREITNYIYDYNCAYTEPLSLYLEAGENTVRLTELDGKADIVEFRLIPCGSVKQYKEVKNDYEKNGYTVENEILCVEAENYCGKSATTIYPISDRSSAETFPCRPGKICLNTVGGYHWNKTGQYLKWNVNVKESGLYKISIRVRQNSSPGQRTARSLYINGEIPFKEAMHFSVGFDSSWQVMTFGDSEEFSFYLKEGVNEIKLVATLGKMDAVLRVIENCINSFNTIYRKFLTVLSATPDLLRDYRLNALYPDQIKQLEDLAEQLTTCSDWVEDYCGAGNEGVALMRNFVRQLKKMHSDPDAIPAEFSYFKSNIGSLGTWVTDAKNQPVEIDRFVVGSGDNKILKANASFFKQLMFAVKEYLSSYITDYEMIGIDEQTQSKAHLEVWVGSGREQAQIIRNLAAKSYSNKSGISVSIKNVDAATLLSSVVANIGPDLVVRSSPDVFNFAMRNAAYSLSRFSDIDNVCARFNESSLITMKYLDNIYGIPETTSFSMLFCRTDILEEFGIEVPRTWDDLIIISSLLENSNMEIGIPAGDGGYLMMLMQNGLDVYADGGKYCLLDTVDAINVFNKYTNFFASYGFPLSYDFLNRFRSGEMPIGIIGYEMYNSIKIAAPEIDGLWEMYPVPGTLTADGGINNCSIESVSAAMILADTEYPQEAWDFIKWWTDSETQIAFADEVESVLGVSARYNSANLEAFEASNWSREQKKTINVQKKNLTAVEPVPGGYYLSRNINNAFRNVVYKGLSPTDVMYEYTYKINSELTKKRTEFGLETAEG